MDRGAWWAIVHEVAKSQTRGSMHVCVHMHTHARAHTHTHTESYSVLYYNGGNMTLYFVQSYRIYNNVYIHSMGCTVHGLLTGQNTRVISCSLLQRIFHTQESNWGLLHWRWILYQMSYMGRPWTIQECYKQNPESSLKFKKKIKWCDHSF